MAAEEAPRDAAKLAAYRKALDTALAAFPDDVELILKRGMAESPDPADRGQGSVAGVDSLLRTRAQGVARITWARGTTSPTRTRTAAG